MSQSVTLRKRRHPDGFVLWDVHVDGRMVGVVRQHAVSAPSWFAYTLTSSDPLGRYPFRRDAVAALQQAVTK